MATKTKRLASAIGESIADDKQAIARELGSDHQMVADVASPFAPDALLSLAHRFDQRLRSTGGRPTDPDWTLSRRIPLKSETWEALREIAGTLAEHGTTVGPGQVASLLLEDQVAQLKELDQASLKNYEESLLRRQTDVE